ncbi:hypothetical protein GCM10007973_30050 [Polymorphobacter multimanifer]|uniref:Glycine/D-amino acid oxidase-like deaminating enzyme n=1 Tax=Polymorphobacter multimanifer TaxID=1070431 RepID=A0A841LFP2_9SPHN|nr:FAD-binding oxidoreductase [Polymorphobacter multimanifer]MBB6227788.1 glycine/D-amino acid oxidase-like deaminating enzyme [Polymorphobacter multimanifer]GGI91771.1 hypothetical protein GCM10007973_30050 [Polymorphobacter multimanifer]
MCIRQVRIDTTSGLISDGTGIAGWLPILGPLPGSPGAYINYVPWLGFSRGPAVARALADMVQGRTPSVAAEFAAFAPK